MDSYNFIYVFWGLYFKGHFYILVIHCTDLWKINKMNEWIWRRPQNMLERHKGLAVLTKHHIQEVQGICPHVSDRPSDQSTQLGHLSHLNSCYHSRSKKNYISVQCTLSGKICFSLCWYHTENFSLHWWLLLW
jgi:hypothetical protein